MLTILLKMPLHGMDIEDPHNAPRQLNCTCRFANCQSFQGWSFLTTVDSGMSQAPEQKGGLFISINYDQACGDYGW